MKYKNILEEELKNKVRVDWFKAFDTTEILGKIDFTVFPKQNRMFGRTPLLWAEAKTGDFDVIAMFVQLILTIGKARTFDKTLPPAFLGAFDFKKIAFVPYISVQDIFYLNDFNWNVAPSNHNTKEFLLIKDRIEATLKKNSYIYDYEKDEKELNHFIKNNVANSTSASRLKVDKNNFIPIYIRWLDVVKPIIDTNWDDLKAKNILDSDFFLADLFVEDYDTQKLEDDISIRESLFVVFENQGYKIAKENIKWMFDATIPLKNRDTYFQFWKLYKRPPIKEFQDYIIERRDLLVPQDIRERKGAFFTPRIWVELSQKYLTDYLGENWQDDYYIWDCAAGTGNLLAGLTNKYNMYASTLDQADINVIQERIDHGVNLLKNNVFQFDFLNDEFIPISKGGKVPDNLYNIMSNEEKRKKLVIYINPPYAEGDTHSENKSIRRGVAISRIGEKYKDELGEVVSELFIQFLGRIYKEFPNSIIATFSTLKYLNSPKSAKFRSLFKAKAEVGFISIGNSFDNVIGSFPIGFIIWNTKVNKETFHSIEVDVYNKTGSYVGKKLFANTASRKFLNDWLKLYYDNRNEKIGVLGFVANDFQNQKLVFITTNGRGHHETSITSSNLNEILIYYAVRHCYEHTWINHNDQFLFPSDTWKLDKEFQSDCLAFALFHEKNQIRAREGKNHWIPFTENEVNAKAKFESNFMTDFMKGVIGEYSPQTVLFAVSMSNMNMKSVKFSEEAQSVFQAGKNLWCYYHSKNNVNVNASLYDIREFFQGRDAKGKMMTKSNDLEYAKLLADLRSAHTMLALKLRSSIHQHGFLIDEC